MFFKIGINTAVSFFLRFAGLFLSLIAIGLMTRSLGAEAFGEYSSVFAYLLIFQALSDFGLKDLLTKEISQKPKNENALVGAFFSVRLLLSLIFIIIGCLSALLFPYSAAVKAGIFLGALYVLFISINQIFLGVFQARLTLYKMATAEFLGRALNLLIIFFLFSAGSSNIIHYVFSHVVSAAVIFLISLVFIIKTTPFRVAAPANWREMLRASLPLAISIIFTFLYFRLDAIMLSVMKQPQDVGFYNISYKVLEAAIFFPAVIFGLFLPILSRVYKNAREFMGELLTFMADISLILAAPLIILGVALSASIIKIAGGEEFLPAAHTLQVLFGAVGVIVFGSFLGSAIVATNSQKVAVWAYFLGFLLNITANAFAIPKYSYEGAAYTTLATEVLVVLILAFIVYKRTRFGFSIKVFLSVVFASLVMGVLAFRAAIPLSLPTDLSTIFFIATVPVMAYLVIVSVFANNLIKKARAIQKL